MSAPGYLRPDELVTVQGTMQLATATAHAWFAMRDAAAADGVTLTIVPPAGAYRTWAMSLDMRVHPQLYNITPGILPGLPSGHNDGNCVDVGQGLAWVKKNGSRFGFTFPLAFDPNHARYDGVTVASTTSTPITSKEDDMATNELFRDTGNGSIYGLNLTTGWEFGFSSADQLKLVQGRPEFASLNLPATPVDVAPSIMTLLRAVAAGARSNTAVDTSAIAAALVPSVLTAVAAKTSLTAADVEAAAATAIRTVFAAAAK